MKHEEAETFHPFVFYGQFNLLTSEAEVNFLQWEKAATADSRAASKREPSASKQ